MRGFVRGVASHHGEWPGQDGPVHPPGDKARRETRPKEVTSALNPVSTSASGFLKYGSSGRTASR
jgi:hypothetical protein